MEIDQINQKITELKGERKAAAGGFEVGTRELVVVQYESAIAGLEIALQIAKARRGMITLILVAAFAVSAWLVAGPGKI